MDLSTFSQSALTLTRLCQVFVWVGGLLIIAVMLITVVDVLARWWFQVGFIGLVDVTQFAVLGFTYLAMPRAFLAQEHVAVVLFDFPTRPRLEKALQILALFLSLFVLIMLLRYGWTQMARAFRYGDVSQNVAIPMVLFWGFIGLGTGLSAVVCLLQVCQVVRCQAGKKKK